MANLAHSEFRNMYFTIIQALQQNPIGKYNKIFKT